MERSQHPLDVVPCPDDPGAALFFRPASEPTLFDYMREVAENDLVCGHCREVLVRGQTVATLWLNVVAKKPVLIVCPVCGACNHVPKRDGGPEEIFWLITGGE